MRTYAYRIRIAYASWRLSSSASIPYFNRRQEILTAREAQMTREKEITREPQTAREAQMTREKEMTREPGPGTQDEAPWCYKKKLVCRIRIAYAYLCIPYSNSVCVLTSLIKRREYAHAI